MSTPDCTDVCEMVMTALVQAGYKIDTSDEDHIDMINALGRFMARVKKLEKAAQDTTKYLELRLEAFHDYTYILDPIGKKFATEKKIKRIISSLNSSLKVK